MVKKTCSSVFLIPYLLHNRAKARELGFINGYIKDINREVDYTLPVYALFKPEDISVFNEFLIEERIQTNNLVDDYDYEGGYIVLVYEFPLDMENDYNLFVEGKYSKMSSKFKENFPKITKIMIDGKHKDEISLGWRVLHKTEDVKKYWEDKFDVIFDDDTEYYRIPKIEEETLDINKVKEITESEKLQNHGE